MGLLRRLLGRDDPAPERRSSLPATWPPPDRTATSDPDVPSPLPPRLAAAIDAADWALVPGPPGFSAANVQAALSLADAASDEITALAAARALERTLGDPDTRELWPAAALVVPLLVFNLLDEHLPHWPARAGLATVAEVCTWDRVAPEFERMPDEDGALVEFLPAWRELRDGLVETLGASYPTAGGADAAESIRAAAVVRAMQGQPY